MEGNMKVAVMLGIGKMGFTYNTSYSSAQRR